MNVLAKWDERSQRWTRRHCCDGLPRPHQSIPTQLIALTTRLCTAKHVVQFLYLLGIDVGPMEGRGSCVCLSVIREGT